MLNKVQLQEVLKPNLAVVEATHGWHAVIDLRTTEIEVPSSIRVQVLSKSSASYSVLNVGFEIKQPSHL